jgi:cell division protein FtsI/penicillin-binding protein 2
MRARFYTLLILFAAVALLWTAYLFTIQIFDPLNMEYYRQVRYKSEKEILVPTRGSIYDSNGNLFVSSVAYYQADIDRKQVSLWAKKKGITLQEAYKTLSKVFARLTSITEDQVYQKLTKNQNLSSIQIYNKIKESELDDLIQYFKKNGLPGFTYSFSSMKRIYSRGINAARLLGSVKETSADYNPGEPLNSIYELKGSNGLEATYNSELAGQTGWREVMYDANKNRVPYPGLHDRKQVNGLNLWLTIDSAIQDVVEEALAEGLQKYGAKNGAAVVMDVNTGKIYAMAGVSSDDYTEDPGFVRVKSNVPVSFLFEPGSTMKPFTALTALDYNLIKPRELFPSGTRIIG